jgi:hypothetical protein
MFSDTSFSAGAGGLPIFLFFDPGGVVPSAPVIALAPASAPLFPASLVLASSASPLNSCCSSRKNSCCNASGLSRVGSYVSSLLMSALFLSCSEMRVKAPPSTPWVPSDWNRNNDSRGV